MEILAFDCAIPVTPQLATVNEFALQYLPVGH